MTTHARSADLFSFQPETNTPTHDVETVAKHVPVKKPVPEQNITPVEEAPVMPAAADAVVDAPVKLAPGRPRSEGSRSAILDATRRLVSHTSIRDLSIEGIAKKAGVGKTTIYRWWPNKVAVVIEAFADTMDVTLPVTGTEDTHPSKTMIRQLDRLLRQLRGRNGKIIADLMAESQCDAKVQVQFNDFYMTARREEIYQLIRDGQRAGIFKETLNTAMAVDMVLGPIFLRLMSGENALDENFCASYPDMIAETLSV